MKDLEKYCIKNSDSETQILKEVVNFTETNEEIPQMISGSLVGNLLKMFIRSLNAKMVLEIGTFTGYSALNMAHALKKGGQIHTCEIIDRHIKNAKNFINKSKYRSQIFIHKGDALNTLENFQSESFDFAFIDADKINYIEYYKKCMHLVKSKGIIVLDNMLWGGDVIDPIDEQSIILNKLSTIINNDNRIYNVLLPIRDGLMVCFKK